MKINLKNEIDELENLLSLIKDKIKYYIETMNIVKEIKNEDKYKDDIDLKECIETIESILDYLRNYVIKIMEEIDKKSTILYLLEDDCHIDQFTTNNDICEKFDYICKIRNKII